MSETEKRYLLRLSEELYEKLESWANAEYRSVNAQIVKVLAEAVARHEREARKAQTEEEIETPGLMEPAYS